MGTEVFALVAAVASAAMQKSPSTPQAPAVPKPPQEAKAPDAALVRKNNQDAAMGPGGGPGTTFLTGSGGVDPLGLNLGRAKLLGE